MKIKLISDLHVDFHNDKGVSLIRDISAIDHDLLVIAGDLCEVRDIDLYDDTWDLLSKRYKKILYVPGNHEYWGEFPWVVDEMIDEVLEQYGNVARLKTGETHVIDGYRFIGDTMWFPDSGQTWMQRQFSDFQQIKNLSHYVFKKNREFVEMFTNGRVQKDDVIITHHVPSMRLVHKIYQGLPENQFFVCEMMEHIKRTRPAMWLYGHTHKQNNEMIYPTWFVANPFGYPREMSTMGFDENLILDLILV